MNQPPQLRPPPPGKPASRCIPLHIPPFDVRGDDGSVLYTISEFNDPCNWEVTCHSYRVDDHERDPVWAEFKAGGPFPFFEEFVDQVIVLSYCRLVSSGGEMLHRTNLEPVLSGFNTPTFVQVPIGDEVLDVPGTLADLWAAIPEPDIEIEGAPPVQEQTWVQASTWWWIDDIETPLVAVSYNPALTARIAVRAKVARIEWDFGDGTDPVTCEADRLIVWDASLDPYADANLGCTYIYKQVANDGFTVVANVTFEGEQVLQARAAASQAWQDPVWLPYAETREVPGDLLVKVFEIASRN